MSVIIDVYGREVLDSRGNPTVEVEVVLEDGAVRPRGGALGRFHRRFRGRGAARRRQGPLPGQGHAGCRGPREQRDRRGAASASRPRTSAASTPLMLEVDGTDNKGALGANAILGASLGRARKAAAEAAELPLYKYVGGANAHLLPTPMMNILNGGVHADNNVDFQEFMIMPVGAPTFRRGAALVRRDLPHAEEGAARCGPGRRRGRRGRLRSQPEDQRGAAGVHRGGLREGRLQAGHRHHVRHGSRFHRVLRRRDRQSTCWLARAASCTSDEMVDYWEALVNKYPIISIEDGMAEEDWDGWKKLTDRIGDRVQLVGDDLFVTNSKRLAKGIELGCANAILIKVNQIGSPHRDARGHRDGEAGRLRLRHEPPLRRDRGHHHRRPVRGVQHRPDQDRRPVPLRPRGQVQPASFASRRSWSGQAQYAGMKAFYNIKR